MANGLKRGIEKAKERKSGKMAASMSAIGRATRPTARDDLYTLMVMYTKANGIMTRLKAKEPTSILMEPNI